MCNHCYYLFGDKWERSYTGAKTRNSFKTNANDSICSAIILEGNNYKSQGNIFRDKIDTLRQNNDSVLKISI